MSTNIAPHLQEIRADDARRQGNFDPDRRGPSSGGMRVPPHDEDAERAVLGAMLLTADAVADAVEILSGQDFYRPAHQHVFNAAIGLYTKGEPVDTVTVHDELERMGFSEATDGLRGLMELQSSTPVAANAAYYAKIVADTALLRRLIKAAGEVSELAFSRPPNVGDALDQAETLIFHAAERENDPTMERMNSLLGGALTELEDLYSRGSAITGITTGFADLDKKLSGLQPSSLVVLGARPSIGKTSLALDIAVAAAKGALDSHNAALTENKEESAPEQKEPHPVLFFSLEMSNSEITQRVLGSEARVPTDRLRTGRLNDDDWSKISTAMGRLGELPLWVDDSPSMSILEVRAKSRRRHAEAGGLTLVVVDYLQLLVGGGNRNENRQVEVSEFSRGLKILARELKCPVLALSQLSRAPETRQDKRPMLADLRESGAIEQDADVVMFLYRDEVYNPESKDRGIAELLIAKHRSGPTGLVKLIFLPNFTKFVDAALPVSRDGPTGSSNDPTTEDF